MHPGERDLNDTHKITEYMGSSGPMFECRALADAGRDVNPRLETWVARDRARRGGALRGSGRRGGRRSLHRTTAHYFEQARRSCGWVASNPLSSEQPVAASSNRLTARTDEFDDVICRLMVSADRPLAPGDS
jgi:hypothetical protein